MSKLSEFLTQTGTFFLATVDGDQPKLRPLGAFLEMDGKVLFGVGDFKEVYRQLLANPKCEMVAAKPDGHWLRYTGKAVFETDPKYAQAMLDAANDELDRLTGKLLEKLGSIAEMNEAMQVLDAQATVDAAQLAELEGQLATAEADIAAQEAALSEAQGSLARIKK